MSDKVKVIDSFLKEKHITNKSKETLMKETRELFSFLRDKEIFKIFKGRDIVEIFINQKTRQGSYKVLSGALRFDLDIYLGSTTKNFMIEVDGKILKYDEEFGTDKRMFLIDDTLILVFKNNVLVEYGYVMPSHYEEISEHRARPFLFSSNSIFAFEQCPCLGDKILGINDINNFNAYNDRGLLNHILEQANIVLGNVNFDKTIELSKDWNSYLENNDFDYSEPIREQQKTMMNLYFVEEILNR
ncbi:hypothetical protein [Clostridium perfringens]|uniref:hypothetical protein n=1 Tax=Clostridium perfringens TaxID=1502 RepID=UPI0024BD4B01|nr:hypothetical protein [Clostridium perfringens]